MSDKCARGPGRSTATRRPVTLATAALVTLGLGGCTSLDWGSYFDQGWLVSCHLGEHEESMPDEICLSMHIEGGATDEAVSAACVQAAVAYYGEGQVPQGAVVDPHIMYDHDDPITCDTETHPFPVTSLEGVGNPNVNAILCDLDSIIHYTYSTGDGYLHHFYVCNDPSWTTEADREAACMAQCELAVSMMTADGYDFDDADPCGSADFNIADAYHEACFANNAAEPPFHTELQALFTDGGSLFSFTGSGATVYDAAPCGGPSSCEPTLFLSVAIDDTTFTVMGADGTAHVVQASDGEVSMVHPSPISTDPRTGAQRIVQAEMEFSAQTVVVDGQAAPPIVVRDLVGPIDVLFDATSGQMSLSTSMQVLGGRLRLTFTGDPATPVSWPAD